MAPWICYWIMSKVRPEEWKKKNNIHAEQSEAGNFLKKYEIRALKFIV